MTYVYLGLQKYDKGDFFIQFWKINPLLQLLQNIHYIPCVVQCNAL